jgi:hexosaminidase
VIATVADLFPFRYIHLGGDEAQTDQWAASEQVQQQKAALGLPSDRAIQEYFTVRLARLLRTHEKLLIGWDEIIEDGTPEPETVIMNWRPDFGFDRKALEMGHGLVLADSSHTYFDHYQVALEHQLDEPLAIGGCTPLEKVYGWNPFQGIPAPLHAGIFGAQAQIWTEYVPNRNALDYMVYPRLCALAQVLWSGSDRETFEGFVRRLKCHLARLDRLGVSYRPLDD